jgi:probable phosphoglycerate mutase
MTLRTVSLNALSNSDACSLYLVRHGRTAFNIDERYLGALDPPLDEVGLRQAGELIPLLQGRVDALVCSPKVRARQTAEVLASALALPVHVIGEFAERHVGVYEGLTQEEVRRDYPALWAQDITRQWQAGPPGGESIRDVFERVAQGLATLQADFAGRSVALIAHGFVAKVIRVLLTEVTWEAFFRYALKNGQIEHYPSILTPTAAPPAIPRYGPATPGP